MSRKAIVLFLLMFVAVAAVAKAAEDATAKKAVTNKKCPVMNASVNEKYRAEYKGQYVYFCCQGCVTTFEKDPETYVAKLSKEDQEAIKTNEICPMTNEPVQEKTHWIEQEGRKVYFCCEGCAESYKKKMAEKNTD